MIWGPSKYDTNPEAIKQKVDKKFIMQYDEGL